MAKGDNKKAQQQIDRQSNIAQGVQNNAQGRINASNDMFSQNYQSGVAKSDALFDEIAQGYRNFASGGNGGGGGGGGGAQVGLDPYYQGFLNRGLEGYENFANTGGFSANDIQDMRARAIAPTRAVYQNAQDNIRRQKALQGGYGPNSIAALAKTSRDLSQRISDANIDANASIAGMVQQGKLAGFGGMQQGSLAGMDRALDVSKANAASSNAAANASSANQMAGIRGLQSLYGDTPGLPQLYGGQLLASNNQLLGGAGSQNQLSLGTMQNQIAKGQVPGDFQQALGNIAGTAKVAGGIAGMFL